MRVADVAQGGEDEAGDGAGGAGEDDFFAVGHREPFSQLFFILIRVVAIIWSEYSVAANYLPHIERWSWAVGWGSEAEEWESYYK